MPNPIYVAVYGSLKEGYYNHDVLGGSPKVGETTLLGWDMYSLGSFPGIKPGEGSIDVEVYAVTPEVFRDINWLEGYYEDTPERGLYNRTLVEVGLDAPAYIYVYNGDVDASDKVESGKW